MPVWVGTLVVRDGNRTGELSVVLLKTSGEATDGETNLSGTHWKLLLLSRKGPRRGSGVGDGLDEMLLDVRDGVEFFLKEFAEFESNIRFNNEASLLDSLAIDPDR